MSELFALLTRFVEAVETIAKNSGSDTDRSNREDNAARQALQDKRDAAKAKGKTPAEAQAKEKATQKETLSVSDLLDYAKDVQPACLKLIAKDKPAFVAILRKYDLQKASETAAVPHYAAILADVNAALEAADAAA